jgi:hypothetical protein
MAQLILIHIGPELPLFINDCIKQARLFTQIEIHVLVNKCNTGKIDDFDNIIVSALEDIPIQPEHQHFIDNTRLDVSFRNGFWRYTTERFYYLYDYSVFKNLIDIFHIETDNLIYRDFTKNLSYFQTRLMWATFDSTNRCIPGFVYFKNSWILQQLARFILSQSGNDMVVLSNFKNIFIRDVGYLPIIKSYQDPIPEQYSHEADNFNCLFDAACVGQYVGGVDPNNSGGQDTTGFINETCIFKCDRVDFEWRVINNLKVPYLNGLPLTNLHIHCKNLQKWMSIIHE